MFAPLIVLSFIIYYCNGQVISCGRKSPCNCPTTSPTSMPTCILNCGQKEDACKESTLNCREGDSCIIQCTKTATCSDYVVINAQKAKDVTVICEGIDACKKGIDITCGTGKCALQCNTEDSCIDWGRIDATESSAFECTGGYCPIKGIPSPFTSSPTENPSSHPIIRPSISPSQSHTLHPTYSSSLPPSMSPTNIITLNPTNPPMSIPSTFPSHLLSNAPSSIPTAPLTSYNPSLEPISYEGTGLRTSEIIVTDNHSSSTINTPMPGATNDSFVSFQNEFDIVFIRSMYYISGVLFAGCCYLSIALCFCIYFQRKTEKQIQKQNLANHAKYPPKPNHPVSGPKYPFTNVIMVIDNNLNQYIVDNNPIGVSVPNMNLAPIAYNAQIRASDKSEKPLPSIPVIECDMSGMPGEMDSKGACVPPTTSNPHRIIDVIMPMHSERNSVDVDLIEFDDNHARNISISNMSAE